MIELPFMDFVTLGMFAGAIFFACRAYFYQGKAMYLKGRYEARKELLDQLEEMEEGLRKELEQHLKDK